MVDITLVILWLITGIISAIITGTIAKKTGAWNDQIVLLDILGLVVVALGGFISLSLTVGIFGTYFASKIVIYKTKE